MGAPRGRYCSRYLFHTQSIIAKCDDATIIQSVRIHHLDTDHQYHWPLSQPIWIPQCGNSNLICLPSEAISSLHNNWLRHRGFIKRNTYIIGRYRRQGRLNRMRQTTVNYFIAGDPAQVSDKRYPSGHGSSGSSVHCDVPYIHAFPTISGIMAGTSCNIVSSRTRPVNVDPIIE